MLALPNHVGQTLGLPGTSSMDRLAELLLVVLTGFSQSPYHSFCLLCMEQVEKRT